MKSLLPYNGNMEQELPIPVRLEVYKKTEKLILERDWKKYGLSGPWLCLTFPCILWDLTTYTQSGPAGEKWTAKSTKIAFPELSDEVLEIIDNILGDAKPRRLEFIREWIEKLENQLKMRKLPYRGNLDSEIPLEIRLEVYKKTIIIIKSKKYTKYGLDTPQLCLLIPCVLWNLKNYLDCGPNNYPWTNCKNAFPEFGKEELKEISKVRKSCSNEETDKKRVEILLRGIVKINQILNQQKNEIQ